METKVFDFIQSAKNQIVYVDVDGTLLQSMRIPSDVTGNKLNWWRENLKVTKPIFSRFVLCAVLKILGCKLIIWTNRFPEHRDVTLKGLGFAKILFSDFQFFGGKKVYSPEMFVIDDAKYNGARALRVQNI